MPAHIDDKPFKCTTCGKYLKNNSSFKVHTQMHISQRSTNKGKPNSCQNCWIVFKTAKNLRNHAKQHCKRNTLELPGCEQQREAMIVQVGKQWFLNETFLGTLPEEGELNDGLEEGELIMKNSNIKS